LLVDLQEIPLGHVDLAPDTEDLRDGHAADGFKRTGDITDGPRVSRDVFPGRTVPAGGGFGQHAVFEDYLQAEPVDLRLAVVDHALARALRVAQPLADPPVEIDEPPDVEGVGKRQHGDVASDLRESFGRCSADALRGGLRVELVRVGGLQPLQLGKQRVVLGVGDLRGVLEVVQVVVPPDFASEVLDSLFGVQTPASGVVFRRDGTACATVFFTPRR